MLPIGAKDAATRENNRFRQQRGVLANSRFTDVKLDVRSFSMRGSYAKIYGFSFTVDPQEREWSVECI